MRLIDADAFEVFLYKRREGYADCFDNGVIFMLEQIDSAPTIDAEPVHSGRWIVKKTATGAPYTVCSYCNTSVKFNDEYGTVLMNLKGAHYCPNCGAKMIERRKK